MNDLNGKRRSAAGGARAPRAVTLALAIGATSLFFSSGTALAVIPGPPEPDPPAQSDVTAKRELVKQIASREFSRKVRENRSDNVPRYRNGRGSIAPYSINDQWCAAFATWVWGRAGFDAFRTARSRPEHLWRSHSGEQVAIQVADLRSWAKRTGRWSVYATPGDLVAYQDRHIGVVMAVDRKRRAIRAIEGNKSDGVRWFEIPMTEIIDYFRPVPVARGLRAANLPARPDVG